MLGASWNLNGGPILIRPSDALDLDNPGPTLDAEELIAVTVNFAADLFASPQRHHHQLNVVGGVHYGAKVLVGLTQFLNVPHKAGFGAIDPVDRQVQLRVVMGIDQGFTALGR